MNNFSINKQNRKKVCEIKLCNLFSFSLMNNGGNDNVFSHEILLLLMLLLLLLLFWWNLHCYYYNLESQHHRPACYSSKINIWRLKYSFFLDMLFFSYPSIWPSIFDRCCLFLPSFSVFFLEPKKIIDSNSEFYS